MKNKPNKIKVIKAVQKVHRLLGFGLSFLLFIWCLSGIVMMFRGFPVIDKQKKLAFSNFNLNQKQLLLPQQCLEANNITQEILGFQISAGSTILYKFIDLHENQHVFDAETGLRPVIDEKAIRNIIKATPFLKTAPIKEVEQISALDQWTPSTKFNTHLPFFVVSFADDARTQAYFSSFTGEPIQYLNASDKFWAWLGAIPHWIYFKDLRIRTALWRNVVIVLSFMGIMSCLTGIALGIQRTYLSWKRNNRLTPYKKSLYKWHHVLGFSFGLLIFTWVLSGFFSMAPAKMETSTHLTTHEKLKWQNGSLNIRDIRQGELEGLIDLIAQEKNIGEIEYSQFDQDNFWLCNYKDMSQKRFHYINGEFVLGQPYDKTKITKVLSELFPEKGIEKDELIAQYDNYYYAKAGDIPLPVLRFSLSDRSQSLVYIDPNGARITTIKTSQNRITRWLYMGLHSLDFNTQFYKSTAWYIIVSILMFGVTALSFSGVLFTIKKMRK